MFWCRDDWTPTRTGSGLSGCRGKCRGVSEGRRECALESVSGNQVRSSAESSLFCVSQPVTSKLGAGRWGEGHLLSSSLCLPPSVSVHHSTITLVRFTSHPNVCRHHFLSSFLYLFLSFFVSFFVIFSPQSSSFFPPSVLLYFFFPLPPSIIQTFSVSRVSNMRICCSSVFI